MYIYYPIPDYVASLLVCLAVDVARDPEAYQAAWARVNAPVPLSTSYQHPEKAKAVAAHTSRFSKKE